MTLNFSDPEVGDPIQFWMVLRRVVDWNYVPFACHHLHAHFIQGYQGWLFFNMVQLITVDK